MSITSSIRTKIEEMDGILYEMESADEAGDLSEYEDQAEWLLVVAEEILMLAQDAEDTSDF